MSQQDGLRLPGEGLLSARDLARNTRQVVAAVEAGATLAIHHRGALAALFAPWHPSYDTFAETVPVRELERRSLQVLNAVSLERHAVAIEREGRQIGVLLPVDVGHHSRAVPPPAPVDARNVMVVYGRDEAARRAMFDFLRALDLRPLEWEQLVGATGKATPFIGTAVSTALAIAQAVVVLMTPDETATLHPDLGPHDAGAQARPNVLLEAGMALGVSPARTVLVEIGRLRPLSDLSGMHVVRLDGSPGSLHALVERLRNAGCPANTSGSDWLDRSRFATLAANDRTHPASSITAEPASRISSRARQEESSTRSSDRMTPKPGEPPRHLLEEVDRAAERAALEQLNNSRREAFMRRYAGSDEPFTERQLLEYLDNRRLTEVDALRMLKEMQREGRVYPNPDGPGWLAPPPAGSEDALGA